ncbi:MAG TPA: hypothetical protein VFL27_10960 [Candidatus Dormibacteraeota bacterium]|nr:hypothetical protein [Candidatus Dormibacteraeota bacterium]
MAAAHGTVYLEHAMRGRARLRVPKPRTPAQVRRTAGRLEHSDRIRHVETNTATGSLLVTFDPDDPLDIIIAELRKLGLEIETTMASARPMKTQSRGAVVVRHVMSGANARLHELTAGNFDLRFAVPAIYLALALRNFSRGRGRLRDASWYQLLYWAFDSFFKLHEEATVRSAARSHGRVVD